MRQVQGASDLHKRFRGELKHAPEALTNDGYELAGLVATIQLINRFHPADQIDVAYLTPIPKTAESVGRTISKGIDDVVHVNGKEASFEDVIGCIVDGEIEAGIISDEKVSTVMITYPEELSTKTRNALLSVISTGSYTLSLGGQNKTVRSSAAFATISPPKGNKFDPDFTALDQTDVDPEILREMDLLVVDSPEHDSPETSRGQPHPTSSSILQGMFSTSEAQSKPDIPNGIKYGLLTAIESHDSAGRFTDWPSERHHGLFTREELAQTMSNVAIGFARCMGDTTVSDSHEVATRELMSLLMDRVEYTLPDDFYRGTQGTSDETSVPIADVSSPAPSR